MRVLTALLIVLSAANGAQAHDARPLSIVLVEQAQGLYRAVVRVPPTVPAGQSPTILWPEECNSLDQSAEPRSQSPANTVSLLDCPAGLADLAITISYPLFNPSISTLLRLQTASGLSVTAVLPPDTASWVVPAEPTWLGVAADYARLGFRHIWEGPDHLLFVAGLMLLAALPRRIFWAITGFTAAHSITLTLATLDLVRVPIRPTEAMIALSIFFLAAEIARGDSNSLSRRYPVCLSFVFGLLHGFGFAGALGDIGLPQTALATGLLFFNLGVELGQLTFIAVLTTAAVALHRLHAIAENPSVWGQRTAIALPCAYALGIPAALWFFERAASAFMPA